MPSNHVFTRTQRAVVAAAVAAALAVTACAGESGGGASPGTTPPTGIPPASTSDGDTSSALGAVCDDWRAALDARDPLGVDGFDPLSPDTEALPAVAEWLSDGLEPLAVTIGKVAVTTPPAGQESELESLLTALGDEELNLRAQIDAAARQDVAGFVVAVEAADAIAVRKSTAATALGAPSCAF